MKIVTILLLVAFYNSLNAQNPSNLNVIEDFFSEITLTDKLESDIPVFLGFGALSSELKGFSIQELSKQFSVSLDDSVYPKFIIEQLQINIVYSDTFEVITKSRVKRVLNFKLDGRFETKNRSIQPISLNKKFSDVVDYDMITDLEKSNYTFVRGEFIELPVWKKLVEPVIIVGAIGTIVYLFFSVRS